MDQGNRLLRIGIFYDGNYFYHVSNYYCYAHPRKARLSIPGLHDFIKKMISEKESIPEKLCQIVDCHYFRGRLPAMEANARQILLNERIFDDILMREGVVTHYLPVTRNTEKGVDVSLALETLELTIFKKFNVVVLIASDGDYIPLVRKLNALGTRVMVLGWDFEYIDDNGNTRNTITSSKLMGEVSYPLQMHKIINGETKLNIRPFQIDSLFVPANGNMGNTENTGDVGNAGNSEPVYGNTGIETQTEAETAAPCGPEMYGRVVHLKNGYGFIAPDDGSDSIFFFWQDVRDCDFNELDINDAVRYEVGRNERGLCAKNVAKVGADGNF